jgi:hypothetical protein
MPCNVPRLVQLQNVISQGRWRISYVVKESDVPYNGTLMFVDVRDTRQVIIVIYIGEECNKGLPVQAIKLYE